MAGKLSENAYRDTARKVARILTKNGELRQHQVAKLLGMAEHNDWGTHAVLNRMWEERLIVVDQRRIRTAKGWSKNTYKFYSVPQPVSNHNIVVGWLLEKLSNYPRIISFN